MTIKDKIQQQLSGADIVLYMKGSPQTPQCGFSARAVQMLNACGATFASYDVLSDPDLRQGLKEFSNWPTFPQLYIGGELVGGCDIMTELFQQGELQKQVSAAQGGK
ncbi:MAG TPA: Grx4 family monothiol glutaredoxin [Burkholderiales bacterium]|nr:Grx4 family monothiol glutaredoxin [Burkholderiales bacterium]